MQDLQALSFGRIERFVRAGTPCLGLSRIPVATCEPADLGEQLVKGVAAGDGRVLSSPVPALRTLE